MLTLELDMYQACALGALVYCLGRLLVQKLPFLSKYCIPAPVAGGVVFAFAHLALYATGVVELSFDTTLQSVFMTIFFILTAIASVGAFPSLLEVPVAILSERFGMGRKIASICTILAIALIGAPAALSQGVLAETKLFGMNPFDLFDFLSSNVLLPVGGILICLFVGWVYGQSS